MSILDALAHWMLPAPAAHVLDVAESMPVAVAAAQAAWDDGRGPLAALAAFSAATDTALDDEAAEQLAAWLRATLAGLDAACAAAVWISEHETGVRTAVDAAFGALFSAAYWGIATRQTLRSWQDYDVLPGGRKDR